ncbi:hypothetical protein EV363DRAFT_1163795 [Boletus edulis]|nr:hypothetical protein EV363DRAFT_1163795 [Boletus edulis]
MQNFRYAPALDEFYHIIHTHSPRAYRFIAEYLPARTTRSIRAQHAKSTNFPIGIEEKTFNLVSEHLRTLGYSGPVGLACDDTKLESSFDPYYDPSTGICYVVGNSGQPIQIANVEELTKVIEEGNIRKAEKLRLWTIQVPLPRIPPIILAALPISNTTVASDLLDAHLQIYQGLCSRNIPVVSYAADGTETERAVQRQFDARATRTVIKLIKHPAPSAGDIQIVISFHGDQPTASIQDSKHGLKTARNNLFSGARLLVLGNFVAMYSQVRRIAFEKGPLLHRDVEKLDRQDDNAASRLFSAHTLDWLIKKNDDTHPGLIIYLFVFGELIDAYQSRHLPIPERVKMALRAYFFLEGWENHLVAAGYSLRTYCISREARDIVRILVMGLLKLVIIFRDHLNVNSQFPLLLWLLSTEPNEHAFGIIRKLVPDFTVLQFVYTIPKLLLHLREAAFSMHVTDAKVAAGGYNHTYTDNRGIDLAALATYPSDNEINNLAEQAYAEVVNLFFHLGVEPQNITMPGQQALPAIHAWFRHEESESDSDEDLHNDLEVEDSDPDDPTVKKQIGHLLERWEEMSFPQHKENKVANLAYASMALVVQDRMTLYANVAVNELTNTLEKAQFDDRSAIKTALANSLPSVATTEERRRPFDRSASEFSCLNLSQLIKLRKEHQTKHSEAASRTRMSSNVDNNNQNNVKNERMKLLRSMREILRDDEHNGGCSGSVSRTARWQRQEGATRNTAGNSANAQQVAMRTNVMVR